MKITIHTPISVVPEVPEAHGVTLLEQRVLSAFIRSFEAKIDEEGRLHNAFQNRYFIVFPSLSLARDFCQATLAPLITKPKENYPQIELRGVVEDKESGKAFCVINLIFPNPQLVEEDREKLERNFFRDGTTNPS